MRSVLTILLLLIPIGFILLYTLGRVPTLETFRGSGGYGATGYRRQGGVEESDAVSTNEQSCYTDFDCPSGHCGVGGLCTNGLTP
jgi:hypothetical protein